MPRIVELLVAGAANSGGGGGGEGGNTSTVGGAGGSGIVIVFPGSTPATGTTLLSRSFTATTTPDKARLAIQAASSASFTLNTDLMAAVSRDGGTTWATSTLVMMGTALEDGTTLYGDSNIDVSTQPSGTSMKYRILTANSKAITIYGAVFQWGAVTALSAANLTVSSALTVSGASTFNSTATTTFGGPISSNSGNFIIGSAGITNNLLLNPYGGNVGMGTTSPATTLSVAGSGYFTGGLGVGVLNTVAGTLQTSGNITGAGTLTITGGLTTLGQASTTLFSSYGPAYFGSTATSSFSSAGALTLASALAVGSGEPEQPRSPDFSKGTAHPQ